MIFLNTSSAITVNLIFHSFVRFTNEIKATPVIDINTMHIKNSFLIIFANIIVIIEKISLTNHEKYEIEL